MVCKYYVPHGDPASRTVKDHGSAVQGTEEAGELGPVAKSEVLKCLVCKLSFVSQEQLEKHKKDPRYHSVCEHCNIEFHTHEGLRRHNLQAHSTKQKLSCTACNKVFDRLGGLIGHIESKECRAVSGEAFTKAVQGRMAEDTASLTLANYIKYGQTTAGYNPRSGASVANSRPSRQYTNSKGSTPLDYTNLGNMLTEVASYNTITTSAAQPIADSSSRSAAPVATENPVDPVNPAFRASRFYIDIIKKYKCPHSGCIKSFNSKRGFIAHLSSAHNYKEKLKCSNCGRLFINVTALTQHCEDELSKCKIRKGADYAVEVDAFTAGVAAVNGRHADGSVHYVTGLTLASAHVKSKVAAQKTAQAEEEEQYYDYWKHNRPAW